MNWLPPTGEAGVSVSGLTVTTTGGQVVVDDVSLNIARGQIAGLIGESGSGKTTVAQAVLGYARPGLQVAGGSIRIEELAMVGMRPRELRRVWGNRITYVPQDTGNSLNPLLRVATHLAEVRRRLARSGLAPDVNAMLELVGLPTSREFTHRRAHQLSGGQQQRLLLAIAFLGRPDLVILDEPTTALDVLTQDMVLTALRDLKEIASPAVLYVSHDLALVNEIADSVNVMYAGRVVEHGPREQIALRPVHPYTAGLVAAVPRTDSTTLPTGIPGRVPSIFERGPECCFRDRCSYRIQACQTQPKLVQTPHTGSAVACHVRGPGAATAEQAELGPAANTTPAVTAARGDCTALIEAARVEVRNLTIKYGLWAMMTELSVQFPRQGCTALVGESGSGKSSMARVLSGLQPATGGRLELDGEQIDLTVAPRSGPQLRKIQYVFQNPASALNPRKTVEQTLRDALRAFEPRIDSSRVHSSIVDVLAQVALPAAARYKYPGQLSGGERQRVGIARALIVKPEILICDEVTSALDVSVQASIATLLRQLCDSGELAIVFVTHNIALVRSLADEVIVLRGGTVTESGRTDDVFSSSNDPYTRLLIGHTPSLADRSDLQIPTTSAPSDL